MIKDCEQEDEMNLMNSYPCQLKDLSLSCYGCCRNGLSSSSQINSDLEKNNYDFKKYYLDKEKSDENLKSFRDRYGIKDTLSSGVCRNLVDFKDSCVACPLHPFVNLVVSSKKTIAPKQDLRVGFCDTEFECETVKFWCNMELNERKAFIRFLQSKEFDNHNYSMLNISGELIQEFFRRRFEFEDLE